MRATVIIPTYNRPHLLTRQLACLAEQTSGLICEVLVCDDGSQTDTHGVVSAFLDRLPGLRLLWQEDRGFRAGQARNMGIAEAQGDVIVFVDDDVLLPGDFIQQHLVAHTQRGDTLERQIVLGFRHRSRVPPVGVCPTHEEMVVGDPDDRFEPLGFDGEAIHASPHPWFYVYSCNFSVPNDPKLVWFDDGFVGWGMEDIELGYRLYKLGYRIKVQPLARVLHVEDPMPRDPFRCVERGLEPYYDTYVHNMVRLIGKYPQDTQLRDLLALDLRWYVRDKDDAHWVKNGHENDPSWVIEKVKLLEQRITTKCDNSRRVS